MRKYECLECGKEYPVTAFRFRCDCGGIFKLKHDYVFSKEKIDKENSSMWRYRRMIPIENDENIVTLGEGMTPLLPFNYKNLNLFVKTEYMSPTGSFKDRGASVLMSLMKEIGVKSFVEDSSGNAGCAVSAYGARAEMLCEIYCPDYTSEGKLNQVKMYGAKLNKIVGTREDTSAAVMEAAGSTYYASHNWNPFFIQGLKTLAYEIAEQRTWNVPDNVITPLGFGGLYHALYLGFNEMLESGAIEKIPKLFGVQSNMCCPIYDAVSTKSDIDPNYKQLGQTMAEGVCGTRPSRGKEILKAVYQSKGGVTTVNEDEIIAGIKVLSNQGFFVEPTSAIVVKAIDHFTDAGLISENESTVVILTGTGLKAVDKFSSLFSIN